MAIKHKPDYIEAYLNRGNVYRKLKQYNQAIEDYNKVISLKPDFALVYNNCGVVFGTLGNYDEEIADYTIAIQYDSTSAEYYP